jgi:hypothetical protein
MDDGELALEAGSQKHFPQRKLQDTFNAASLAE